MSSPTVGGTQFNRKRAALAVAPFLALGLGNVILLLGWGINPLWGFMILPPILFISVLGWIAFRGGFVQNRGQE
jgi:cobalamin synthase